MDLHAHKTRPFHQPNLQSCPFTLLFLQPSTAFPHFSTVLSCFLHFPPNSSLLPSLKYFLFSYSLLYFPPHYLGPPPYSFMFPLFHPLLLFCLKLPLYTLPFHLISLYSHSPSSTIHSSPPTLLPSSLHPTASRFAPLLTTTPSLALSFISTHPVLSRRYQGTTPNEKCHQASAAHSFQCCRHARARSLQLCLFYTQMLILD